MSHECPNVGASASLDAPHGPSPSPDPQTLRSRSHLTARSSRHAHLLLHYQLWCYAKRLGENGAGRGHCKHPPQAESNDDDMQAGHSRMPVPRQGPEACGTAPRGTSCQQPPRLGGSVPWPPSLQLENTWNQHPQHTICSLTQPDAQAARRPQGRQSCSSQTNCLVQAHR